MKRYHQMKESEQAELHSRVKKLCESPEMVTVEDLEQELYERYKAQMVSNSFTLMSVPGGPQGVMQPKNLETYAAECAYFRGALDFCTELKNFRAKIMNYLIEQQEKKDAR